MGPFCSKRFVKIQFYQTHQTPPAPYHPLHQQIPGGSKIKEMNPFVRTSAFLFFYIQFRGTGQWG